MDRQHVKVPDMIVQTFVVTQIVTPEGQYASFGGQSGLGPYPLSIFVGMMFLGLAGASCRAYAFIVV